MSCFIRRRADFARVTRRGRVIRGGGWRLHYAENAAAAPRFAVAVGKRHVRAAARRNRIKRCLRERFRQEWRFDLPAMDFFARLTDAPRADAVGDCRRLLARAAAATPRQ